jgi:membrane protease YdiL (CAAX protease family)
MENRLSRKDITLILICLAILLISGFVEITNYPKAFPEHAIDFKINRQESKDLALGFLQSLSNTPESFKHAVAFEYDNTAKTFIEKEIGIEESHDLLTNDFRLWRWTNRWFKPLSREEFIVGVTPKGEIVDFDHRLPEEAAAPSLSIEDARRLSQKFLQDKLNIGLNNWEFLEDKTDVKPNRVDHLFTYKKKNFEIYNATYRFDVVVQGDQIGSYREYLHVPEEWLRSYQRLRSLNSTTATSAQVLFVLLIVTMVISFIIYLSRKQLHLRTAICFGIVTFGLSFLSDLNQLPSYLFDFDTNQSLGAFYGFFFITTLLKSLLIALLIIIITGAGEHLYRTRYPRKIPLENLFKARGLRSKNFFIGVITGVSLAIAFMAFQTVFYLTARRYGAWAPADVSYSEILNTRIPWIMILIGGFLPAVLEEFSFRLFAIPFFEKILKSRVLAILLPAVIWGFAHANYPNQPFWIRGFEVSMFGILLGFIFLRFGIIAVLIWHYTIDAIYSSIVLFQTGEPYLIISSALAVGIMLIPLGYNILMYFKNRGFSDEQVLLSPIPAPSKIPREITIQPEPPQLQLIPYTPLTYKRRKTGVILLLLFILILFLPYQQIGEFYNYPVTRQEITRIAQDFLRSRGLDPATYKITSALENDYPDLAGMYILENSSISTLNLLLAQHLNNAAVWKVRFYRPLEKEEYLVYLHPREKKIVGFEHLQPEDAAAISLGKESALQKAEDFLDDRGYQTADFKLIEDQSKQLKNRKEYNFIWESNPNHPASIENGKLRLKVMVSGDEISSFSISYKVPEDWERQKTQKTLWDSIRLGLQILTLVLIAILSLVVIPKKIKAESVPWKTTLIISSILGALWLIIELANYPYALVNYNSSWSPTIWTIFWVILTFLRCLAIFGLLFILLTIITILFPAGYQALRRANRVHYARDAVFNALLMTVGLVAVNHFSNWLKLAVVPHTISPTLQMPNSINYTLPFAYTMLSIVTKGIMYTAILGIIIFWVRATISHKTVRILAIAVLCAIFLPGRFYTLTDFATLYANQAILIIWLGIAVVYFLRDNLPAYLYSFLTCSAVSAGINLIKSGTPKSTIGALLVFITVTLSIVWLLTEKRNINITEYRNNRERS